MLQPEFGNPFSGIWQSTANVAISWDMVSGKVPIHTNQGLKAASSPMAAQ